METAIAALRAQPSAGGALGWKAVVSQYNSLIAMRPSPEIALNRAIAVAQDEGPERGLEALHSITGSERLGEYPFYIAALGELEFRCGRNAAAGGHLRTALTLARSLMESDFPQRRVRACEGLYPPAEDFDGYGTQSSKSLNSRAEGDD